MEPLKAKKRPTKARPVAVPTPKKAKRPASCEIDEQWQKYNKQLSAPIDSRKKSTPNKKDETSSSSSPPPTKAKKTKKSNPLLKHREPCDLMRDEKRLKNLTDQMQLVDGISEENHQQKALAVNVMPARERQNIMTLSLNREPVVYSDNQFSVEMKRLNYERTTAENTSRSYPLQDLMGEQGFFSINNEHIDQVLSAIVKDKRNDIIYAKHSLSQNARAQQGKVGGSGGGGDASNKKLNCIFGGILYSFGYNRRTPQIHYKKAKAHDIEDRAARLEEYYRYDQLDNETSIGAYAHNFPMFKTVKRQLMPKYLNRHKNLRDTAALTPKTDLEEISREYIASFRQPPVGNEEVCANREQCVFNTFSADKNVRYIGKVFYTENERARLLRRQLSGEVPIRGVDDDDDDDDDEEGCNTHLLCYECLIRKWTIEWVLNIQHETVPERPINYFTVMCKPGQYSPHCMLSMVENDKPTGIIGHVPRFSNNNLHIVALVRSVKRDGKYIQISVPMLDETGMDF